MQSQKKLIDRNAWEDCVILFIDNTNKFYKHLLARALKNMYNVSFK